MPELPVFAECVRLNAQGDLVDDVNGKETLVCSAADLKLDKKLLRDVIASQKLGPTKLSLTAPVSADLMHLFSGQRYIEAYQLITNSQAELHQELIQPKSTASDLNRGILKLHFDIASKNHILYAFSSSGSADHRLSTLHLAPHLAEKHGIPYLKLTTWHTRIMESHGFPGDFSVEVHRYYNPTTEQIVIVLGKVVETKIFTTDSLDGIKSTFTSNYSTKTPKSGVEFLGFLHHPMKI
jgi:hypothetical protein